MAALDSLLLCIFDSSIVLERSEIAAHVTDPANRGIITQLSKLMLFQCGGNPRRSAGRRGALHDGFLMLDYLPPPHPPQLRCFI
jgi:hypothetical protein